MRIICEYLESTERFLQNAPFFLLFLSLPCVCYFVNLYRWFMDILSLFQFAWPKCVNINQSKMKPVTCFKECLYNPRRKCTAKKVHSWLYGLRTPSRHWCTDYFYPSVSKPIMSDDVHLDVNYFEQAQNYWLWSAKHHYIS